MDVIGRCSFYDGAICVEDFVVVATRCARVHPAWVVDRGGRSVEFFFYGCVSEGTLLCSCNARRCDDRSCFLGSRFVSVFLDLGAGRSHLRALFHV